MLLPKNTVGQQQMPSLYTQTSVGLKTRAAAKNSTSTSTGNASLVDLIALASAVCDAGDAAV